MKTILKTALAGAALLASVTVAHAELYRVTSIGPGTTPFIVNTSVAKVVAKHTDDIDLQVRATGAATQHFVEAGSGQVDFLFSSPAINLMVANKLGPFANLENNREIEANVAAIFSYQIGPYHFVTTADSGIESLEDIKGRKVFAGPPGGAATRTVTANIKTAFGYEPGTDYDLVQFGWDAAGQAFQDGKIDVIIIPSNAPSPLIEQFALTKEIRLLEFPIDRIVIDPQVGATPNEIAPDAYGDAQVNTETVKTWGAVVSFSAGMHVPDDVVYEITKAIWANRDELVEAAKWMDSTITLDNALTYVPSRLHPGAERYYREIGLTIPEFLVYE